MRLHPIAGPGVTLLLLSLAGCGAASPEEPATTPVVAVKTIVAAAGDITVTVSAPATVFPREQANIASRITAPIRELRARKGDRVGGGQVLAVLDNRDLLAQRQEIAAVVRDADISLEKIRTGTVPADIEKARGQVAITQAALDQARKFYERRKQLFDQGAIPGRDFLVSQTDLATAQANAEVAQQSLKLLEQQSSGRDIQIAESRLEQARGRLAGIDAQIAFSELRSPFAGTLVEQFLFPGDMAQPSASIFTVADLDVVVARAQVPEANSSGIRIGQTCFMSPSDREGARYAGRVSVVNQAVDPARRTVEVWCEIPNAKGELKSQVFGTVEIVTGRLANLVALPPAAVQLDEGTRTGFVMVVEGGKARKKPVETGTPASGRLPVLKGLSAGEAVIVEGAYGLADGTAVITSEDARR